MKIKRTCVIASVPEYLVFGEGYTAGFSGWMGYSVESLRVEYEHPIQPEKVRWEGDEDSAEEQTRALGILSL